MTQQRLSRTLCTSLLSSRVTSKLRCSKVCCVASLVETLYHWTRCGPAPVKYTHGHRCHRYMDKRKNRKASMNRGLAVARILAHVDAWECSFPLPQQPYAQGIATRGSRYEEHTKHGSYVLAPQRCSLPTPSLYHEHRAVSSDLLPEPDCAKSFTPKGPFHFTECISEAAIVHSQVDQAPKIMATSVNALITIRNSPRTALIIFSSTRSS